MRPGGRDLGRLGEAAARRYLESHGLRTLAQNVRTRYGELDLVCRAGEVFVFVEVKTRASGAAVGPLEAISTAKAARLVRLAEAYLVEQSDGEVPWRIDVVAVEVDRNGRVASLVHIPNAVTGQ
ncbi:MAG: YraN family protein [Chloroflexi bacterium]|nr:YraN family protein [Chloroflexota bacterium]